MLNYLKDLNEIITNAEIILKTKENPQSKTLRALEKTIYFAQYGFVFGYTGIMLKLAFFNHYRRYNRLLKFSIVWLYQISIDPLTIFAGYMALVLRQKAILAED